MTLNKSKGNMYQFIDATVNPICGACGNKCKYCYVDRMKKQYPVIRNKYSGKIRLDEKVLKGKLKEGKFYFIVSMGDLFAKNVPDPIIKEVFKWLNKYPDNTYLLQSKNPGRFIEFAEVFPRNTVFGTTIESNRHYENISKAPRIYDRIRAMTELRKMNYRTMVTIEPVLDFDVVEMIGVIKLINPEWVNLGADSGGNKLSEPSKEKLLELISRCDIRQKSNLKRLLK